MSRISSNPWKLAWVAVVVLAVLGASGYLVRETRDRFWKAEQAEQWRTQPLLRMQDGQVLTREQLIELALADFVARQQGVPAERAR